MDHAFFQPGVPTVVIHAVLDAGARDQYVVVQTTTGSLNQQKEVAGAEVVITTPDGRALRADEIRDTLVYTTMRFITPQVGVVYRVSLDNYGVSLVGGGTYSLHVQLPDGREVAGHTTIPTAPQTPPINSSITFDRSRDTLRLAWPASAGTRVYEVFVSSSRSVFTTFADTSIALPGTAQTSAGSFAFIPGATSQLVVSAVDDNYYDYYRRGSDPFSGGGIETHLVGGIGLFGSIVPVARRTLIVR